MSTENPVRARGPAAAATRVVLVAALAAALAGTVLTTGGSAVRLVGALLSGRTSAALVSGAAVPPGGARGHIVEGTFRVADLVLRDVPSGVIALSTIADAAGLLARAAVGGVLVVLLLVVLRRAPFTERAALVVALGGGVTVVAALLGIGLGVLRDWMLADLVSDGGSGTWPASSIFDPTLLVVGFGAMVVGLLLEHGARLQRETAGLV